MALAHQESAETSMISSIDFEDIATWPAGLKAALDKDVTCRGLEEADGILSQAKLLGFHCTRLLPYEAAEIMTVGLRQPSPIFLEQRINKARDAGYLTADICARLLASNQASDANRVGEIRFVTKKSLLRVENQVRRFFESWGGEALYNSHEDDPITGPQLRSIGMPHIVMANLPLTKVSQFQYGLARDFANKLENDSTRGEAGKSELSHVGVRSPVPPEWGIKLVSFQNPTFESLTNCHMGRWNLCAGHGLG